MENSVKFEGIVKWDVNVWPPKEEGQSEVRLFALEQRDKSDRATVLHIKAFGKMSDLLKAENVGAGDTLIVSGRITESRWKDKKTDQWTGRIEMFANEIEIKDRVGGSPVSEGDMESFQTAMSVPAEDSDLPF